MTIAVVTPSGHVGSRVAQLLVQAGAHPRLLAHSAARLPADLPPLADVVEGDLLTPGFLTSALAGCDTLFWATPEDFTAEDPLADIIRMGSNAADAIRANNVQRVVQISSVGAEKGQGAGLIDGLARNEEQLAATGAAICVLRCGYFFTNLLGMLDGLRSGVLTTAMPPSAPMAWVDPRDIGDVAAARLLNPSFTSEVTAVHGPADLSWSEVAGILGSALGRDIELTTVDDDTVRAGLLSAGLSAAAADGVVGMTAGLREDFTPAQPRTFRTTTPTSLAAWAYANLRPLL